MIEENDYTFEPQFAMDLSTVGKQRRVEMDAIMVETINTLSVISDENKKKLKQQLNAQGVEGEPMEVLIIRERGKSSEKKGVFDKQTKALQVALATLMRQQEFPRVLARKDISGGYQTIETSALSFIDGTTVDKEKVTGTELKEKSIIFIKTTGVSDNDYRKARTMIISEANSLLDVFGAQRINISFPNID